MKHMIPSAPLIEIEYFKELFKNKNTVILDATIDKVNQKIDNKVMELIPGSLFFDIEEKFSDHNSPFPHTMVNAKTFEMEVQKLGISQESIIVIYDRWGVYSSPRAWWMFRYMGHEKVYVLNGGLPIWKEHHLPLTTTHIQPEKSGNFKANTHHAWFISKQELVDTLGSSSITITDARSKGRFDGTAPEPRPGLRSGHIPGSTSLPFDQVFDDVFYKDPEELQPLLSQHLSVDKRNVFTCGSGITASVLALAAYQNGYQDIAVYDGSWSEWGADPCLPLEDFPNIR